MAVSFRFARIDEYPVLSKFLNDYWAENHVYCRDKALFDWTFHANPNWGQDGYCFAMAENNGELVGILGGIPFGFNHKGQRMSGVWIANYVVRPDHRKGTLALQLLSQFRRPEFKAVVASGINPATITIYKVLRGEVLPLVPRHFAVMPGAVDRMKNLLAIAYPDMAGEQAASLAGAFELNAMPAAPASHGNAIPATWDAVDWKDIGSETIGAARDATYLKWRYVDHPTFQYRIVTVPDGSRTGLAVWRLETIRQKLEDGSRKDVDRIGRLVEFLPASRDNADHLLGAVLGEMRANDVFAMDYYGFHGETRCWLGEMGLKLADAHPDGEKIPSRFQPLDGKGGGILSAMFRPEGVPSVAIEPSCPWYWTKSDSDQDRPN